MPGLTDTTANDTPPDIHIQSQDAPNDTPSTIFHPPGHMPCPDPRAGPLEATAASVAEVPYGESPNGKPRQVSLPQRELRPLTTLEDLLAAGVPDAERPRRLPLKLTVMTIAIVAITAAGSIAVAPGLAQLMAGRHKSHAAASQRAH